MKQLRMVQFWILEPPNPACTYLLQLEEMNNNTKFVKCVYQLKAIQNQISQWQVSGKCKTTMEFLVCLVLGIQVRYASLGRSCFRTGDPGKKGIYKSDFFYLWVNLLMDAYLPGLPKGVCKIHLLRVRYIYSNPHSDLSSTLLLLVLVLETSFKFLLTKYQSWSGLWRNIIMDRIHEQNPNHFDKLIKKYV